MVLRSAALFVLLSSAGLPAAAQTSRPSDPESRPWAEALIEAGRRQEQDGRIEEALRSYDQALATAEASADGATAAKALIRLGRTHASIGRYEAAQGFVDRARAVSESLHDETGITIAQQSSAWLAFWAGRRDEAIEQLSDACRAFDSAGPAPDAANCHGDLSLMLLQAGRNDWAVDEATRAIRAFEALNDRFRVAFVRGILADAHIARLDFAPGIAEAESSVRELLDLDRKGPAAMRMAQLAVTYTTLGRHPDALRNLAKARAIYEQSGDRRNLAIVSTIHARTLCALGRYREALEDAEAALPVIQASNPFAVGVAYEVLAGIQEQLGDLDAAKASYEHALAELERTGEADAARRARIELAYVAQLGGDATAIGVYQAELAGCRASGDREGGAEVMSKLGAACFDLGRFDDAAGWLSRSADDFRALGLMPRTAEALSLLARTHCERQRFADALGVAKQALALGDELDRRANLGRTLSVCARASRKLGAPKESVAAAKKAIEAENAITEPLGEVDSERLRTYARDACDEGLLATIEDQDRSAEARDARIKDALWFIEQSRSRVLGQTLASRRGILARRLSLPSLTVLEATRSRLDAAQRARDEIGPDTGEATLLETARGLEAARADWDRAITRVHREARRVADLAYPRPVDRDALRRALPPRTAFVAFQVTRERVVALALDADRDDLVDLGPRDGIIRKVEAHHRFLATPASAEETLGRALYDALLRPVEPILLRNDRILVSPDGILSLLSFDALIRTRAGESERVIEKWSVTLVPSGTVLDILRNDAPGTKGENVLALGDPIYPAEEAAAIASRPASPASEVALRSNGLLDRLPGSGEEARAIAELLPEDRRVLLVRGQATRERLIEALRSTRRRFRTIHLACHGIVDTERPRLSGIVLGGGTVLGIDDLFGMEVPADLAVLSACETAGQTLTHGEGAIGLARGFLAGGCGRVLVSNWRVPDASTRDLMIGIHRRILKDDIAPDAAARAAKLARLKGGGRLGHPFYWAGFVLWGLPD